MMLIYCCNAPKSIFLFIYIQLGELFIQQQLYQQHHLAVIIFHIKLCGNYCWIKSSSNWVSTRKPQIVIIKCHQLRKLLFFTDYRTIIFCHISNIRNVVNKYWRWPLNRNRFVALNNRVSVVNTLNRLKILHIVYIFRMMI